MTDEEKFRERLLRRRIDRLAESWWLNCPTHGRAPADPYEPSRCSFCVVGYNVGDGR